MAWDTNSFRIIRSDVVRVKVILGIVLSLALALVSAAQTAQELYQRGLVQENSKGNLNDAIKLYSQAAKTAGRDRALAAKALIRLADCEEKLGLPAQAASAWAEVVRAYPEQRAEASIAQEMLNRFRKISPGPSEKSQAGSPVDAPAVTRLFETYCNQCHNAANRSGGLDFRSLNAGNVSENTSTWEDVLRRLRARRDPPANLPRPDDKTYRAVISRLEQTLDAAYSASNPERVTDTEWATRIAALVWGAAPDASLLEDARNGSLRDPAVLNRQIGRMLRDPKSSILVANFLEPWLSLDQLNKNPIDPELLHSMQTEARLFLESQLHEDRPVLELWTANYTYMNDRLARHYGITGISGKGFQRVAWHDRNRAGLLGMAGPLSARSSASRTSPTMRGIYVLRNFMGIDPPAPPANVPPLSDTAAARERSMRDRTTAHKANASCANCHGGFDPIGLALENFDAAGQWRATDGGAPIDASGAFVDGTRFNGPAELRAGLLKYSDAYYANVTQQLLAYALNRRGRAGRLYDYEMPSVRTIVRSSAAKDYLWSSILSGVVTSGPFRMKTLVP
jgi:mono/diheme cytochrome c family protein